ncbi:hypothetical protein RB595_007630 [Gaeumannomyces hyphopodioides]
MKVTHFASVHLISLLATLPTLGAAPSSSKRSFNDADSQADAVPFITLEEHWVSPVLLDLFVNNPITPLFGLQRLVPSLAEIGPGRLAEMDAGGVAVQVVSHAPAAPEAMYMAAEIRLANDQLAERIRNRNQSERFRGFCALPMALPAEAAAELRRCVKDLGFVGALLDAQVIAPGTDSTNDTRSLRSGHAMFYDSPSYDVFWSAAVELDVPLYLHPTYPPFDDIVAHGSGLYAAATENGSYSDNTAVRLGTAAWGWHEHTGLSFIKMYAAGVFARFPRLQVVLGHMGEMLPYYLSRVEQFLAFGSNNNSTTTPGVPTLREVYQRNVYVTLSGIFSLEPMHTLLNVTDTRRILYSVDYPFASSREGKSFMERLRVSGLVDEDEYRDIAYLNAKRLLKL